MNGGIDAKIEFETKEFNSFVSNSIEGVLKIFMVKLILRLGIWIQSLDNEKLGITGCLNKF